MKFHDLASFKKYFVEKKPAVTLLVAKEERDVAKEVLQLCAGRVRSFDAETFVPARFFEEVETLSFLEKKCACYVEGVDTFSIALSKVLVEYVARPNPHACVILSASVMKEASKLCKEVEKQGAVLVLSPPKPWEMERQLIEWLIAAGAQEGLLLQTAEAKTMIARAGTDRELLVQEVRKMVCYVGKEKGTLPPDWVALVTPRAEHTLWQLGEAIFQSDFPKAVTVGKQLLEGSFLLPLLAHLRSQVESALGMMEAYEEGGFPSLTAAFPYLKGTLAEKKITLLKSYGTKRLKLALLQLMSTEVSAKSQPTSPEILLELLLCKLCHSTSSQIS